MNEIVPEVYAESVHRLALGLTPVDALSGGRPLRAVRLELEGEAPPRRRLYRHPSGRYVLLYEPHPGDHVDLRLTDPGRHWVPRRLRIPLLTREAAESRPFTDRARRPALFPGAAYDTSSTASGLRGRVVRGGEIVRWARVEARLPASGTLVGRAQGDDRGEFLLLLWPRASPFIELTDPLPVAVTAFGPHAPPAPATPELAARDPLWDLPREELAAPGAADPAAAGEVLPAGYDRSVSRLVELRLERQLTGLEVEDFELEDSS